MTEKRNDGGSAFPMPGTETALAGHGMTLRAWFAGMVLASLEAEALAKTAEQNNFSLTEAAAKISYQFADAMLKDRDK